MVKLLLLSYKGNPMAVHVILLPEDERTFGFDIARSTKWRQGRGDMRFRGDADTLPFAMEVLQKGKNWYIPDYCAHILVKVIHVYGDATINNNTSCIITGQSIVLAAPTMKETSITTMHFHGNLMHSLYCKAIVWVINFLFKSMTGAHMSCSVQIDQT